MAATKAFVHQFSINLRADLFGTAVRVTDIQPGLAGGTEFSEVRFKGDKKKAEAVYEGTQPLTAEDVADAIHWVATRPAHVNMNTMQIMPVGQAFGPLPVKKKVQQKRSLKAALRTVAGPRPDLVLLHGVRSQTGC